MSEPGESSEVADEPDLWVAVLHISDRTAEKIHSKHWITPDEVRQAVVCVTGLDYGWDDDPERGMRALVDCRIRGARVIVVLYPATEPPDDVYHLGSAYPRNT